MSKYSKGYYVLSKNSENKEPYHWVLKAPNHEVILTSETYASKHGALNGIESVKKNSPFDENYQRLIAKDDSPYFNLRAKNYEVIGTSEMYSSEQARDHGIEAVKKYGVTTVISDETSSDDGSLGLGATIGVTTSANSEDEKPEVTERPEKSNQAGRYA